MCGSDLIMFGLSTAAVLVSGVTISMWWNSRKNTPIVKPGNELVLVK